MITVTVCNRPGLLRLLAPEIPVIGQPATVLLQLPPSLTLLYGKSPHVHAPHGVFIAGSEEELPASFSGGDCVAIIDSSKSALRTAVAHQKRPTLTCGRSGADSLTFSSWQEDRAVISLLRPLTAFDGSVVEPFELPVAYEAAPQPFDLLACAALYSLLGRDNPLEALSIWRLPK